jgi:hypothetical protein
MRRTLSSLQKGVRRYTPFSTTRLALIAKAPAHHAPKYMPPCCLRRLIIQPTIIRPVRVHKARECARAAERRTFVFAFNISVFLKHFEAFFWHEKSLAVHTSALLARNENAG